MGERLDDMMTYLGRQWHFLFGTRRSISTAGAAQTFACEYVEYYKEEEEIRFENYNTIDVHDC